MRGGKTLCFGLSVKPPPIPHLQGLCMVSLGERDNLDSLRLVWIVVVVVVCSACLHRSPTTFLSKFQSS